MTVRRRPDGMITLEGSCGVEDAEPLLQMLIATPRGPIDWTSCDHIHAAVVQVLLFANPAILGPCGDRWAEKWIKVGV